MGTGRASRKTERKVNNSPTARRFRTHSPVEYVVPELFAKSCDDVRPCFGSPVPFVAWEKLNCFPEQVVAVQIVGVDGSLFKKFYQLVVLIVAPIYHGGGRDRVPVLCYVVFGLSSVSLWQSQSRLVLSVRYVPAWEFRPAEMDRSFVNVAKS